MRSTMKRLQSLRNRADGYTLIETAIVLMIIGLMLASFMAAYRVYLTAQARLATEVNTAQLADNLGDFLVRNGRYPCPARLNADRGDADYGIETQCDAATPPELPVLGSYPTNITPGVPTLGSYVDGLYFETSEKFADINPSSVNDAACNRDTGPLLADNCVIPRVRRGAVPFRTLGIPEEKAEDGYKNRIQYVITESLAVARTYTKSGGGINIIKGNPAVPSTEVAVINPAYSAHFFLFSSGPDKKGAYTRYGKMVEACDATVADGQNCNTGTGSVLSRSVYRHAEYSTVTSGPQAARHFDDFAKFYSSVQTPLWQVLSGGFDIKDLIEAEATPTKKNLVGISVNPDNNETNFGGLAANVPVLQVGGNILADGNTLAAELCDAAHNNCFQVDKLSTDGSVQDEDHFQCPAGTTPYATGIGSQKIKCTANIVMRCGAGEVMTGVKPSGELECTAVVGCLPRSVNLCTIAGVTDTRNIGGGTQGQTTTFSPVSGSSYTETWTCGPGAGGAGEWTRTGTSGFCVCNPVNTVTTDACNNRRTGNWTGVYTDTFTHVCPANTSSTSSTNNCVCSPRTESRTVGCAAGLTGAITQTRNWVCDSTTAGHYTAWTNASSTCTCTPASETQTVGCAAGLTGSIKQQRTFNCLATPPAWGAWGTISNTCACVSTSETRNVSCPANYVGQINQKRDFTCPSASWGAWYQTGSTCTCSGGSETRTVACTAPLVGSKREKRDFNCMASPPAYGGWYLDEDNCGLVTYAWAPKTAPTGPYGSPLPNSAGGACSNNTLQAPCSAATAGAQYYHYTVCQCE